MSDLFSRLAASTVRRPTRPAISNAFVDPPPSVPNEHDTSLRAPSEPVHARTVPDATHGGVRDGDPAEPGPSTADSPTEQRRVEEHSDVRSDGSISHRRPAPAAATVVADRIAAPPVPTVPLTVAVPVSTVDTAADIPTPDSTPNRSRDAATVYGPIVNAEVRAAPAMWDSGLESIRDDRHLDPQPTMQIHIGRLEVRTNIEQSSPEKPAKRARGATTASDPSLSLDDYLSGRKVAP